MTVSSTTQDIAARAQMLYVAYYGRPADPGGLDYWIGQFELSDSADPVLAAFGASAEYQALLGAVGGDGFPPVVTNLYQQMFNRDPDPEGLAFYVGLLERGERTLASIALDVANGAQNEDLTILNNKIIIANEFTERVRRDDVEYRGGPHPVRGR